MKILVAILILVATPAWAETFYNAKGQQVGRSSTTNAGTTFYNTNGQQTGRSVTTNTGTTFYNPKGQQAGRSK